MNSSPIFHFCSKESWQEALRSGCYSGSALDRRDGFIHFSAPSQVRETARMHLAGVAGLVLLEVDAAALGPALRWETSRDGEAFPHLYGELPVDAVTEAFDLLLGDDGLHVFPDGV